MKSIFLLAGMLVLSALACQAYPAPVATTPEAKPSPAASATSLSATPTAVAPAAPVATARPTPPIPTAGPSPTLAASAVPTSTLASELFARLRASASPTPAARPGEIPRPGPAIEGVEVAPTGSGGDGRPLWVAYTYGLKDYLSGPSHFVAVYTYDDARWQELGRLELKDPDVGYVARSTVKRVPVEPSGVWLEVPGGVGAHGGVYYILRFDGRQLKTEASAAGSSPGVGNLSDLDSDGVLELIIDQSDPYVFFYAASVRLYNVALFRWDGSRMAEVKLARLSDSAPADLRRLVDAAIDHANAELWKDAGALAGQILALRPSDQTARWDALLIRKIAEGRAIWAKDSPYPLIEQVFYGDYAATLDIMRKYSPAQIFDRKSPLIVGTSAEGSRDQLEKWILESADKAIAFKPDLAAAYFIRGWSHYLKNPGSAAALADVKKAADLTPSDRLFADSANYLSGNR
ncbi:MAG: hypothetical protein HY675_23790 [Chloroflexi bacterium]|nr:hypothetical protein [Chloroflexota bacterium]